MIRSRLLKDKRAVAEYSINIIRTLVIIVLIAVPIIAFAIGFAATGKSSGQRESCKLSIVSAAQLREEVQLATGTPLRISCPADYVKIRKREVTKGGEINWNLLNGRLSEELYKCYVKTAKGKYNPFPKRYTGSNVCLVCSHLDMSEMEGTKLVGFELYLATKRVPGQKLTFYQAITGEPADSEYLKDVRDLAALYGADTYPLGPPYAVVWRVTSMDLWKSFLEFAGPIATVGVAAAPLTGGASMTVTGLLVLGGAIGSGIMYLGGDTTLLSQHLLVPEAMLTASMKDVFEGKEIPWKFQEDELFCDVLIDMK